MILKNSIKKKRANIYPGPLSGYDKIHAFFNHLVLVGSKGSTKNGLKQLIVKTLTFDYRHIADIIAYVS